MLLKDNEETRELFRAAKWSTEVVRGLLCDHYEKMYLSRKQFETLKKRALGIVCAVEDLEKLIETKE